MRAKRAIYSPAKNAGDSRGSLRSLAAQKTLARDDNAGTEPLAGDDNASTEGLLGMTI
jgi:hypothetical protein